MQLEFLFLLFFISLHSTIVNSLPETTYANENEESPGIPSNTSLKTIPSQDNTLTNFENGNITSLKYSTSKSNNNIQNDRTKVQNASTIVTHDSQTRDNTDNDDEKFAPGLTQQKFLEIDGYEIADLQNSPKFPDKPDEVNAISDINHVEGDDVGVGDSEDHSQSFGERIFGYFRPPQDGKYIFKISSKATSQFSLSQTEKPRDLKMYASVRRRQLVKPNQFDKYLKQRSLPIYLKANKMFFFEILHKVLYGPHHIQLGAVFPDGSDHTPLEGIYFFSMKDLSQGGGSSLGNAGAGSDANGAGNGENGGGGGSGGGGNGDMAGNGLGNGGAGADALKAAYEAGLKAGQQNGQDAGATAGENAGKQAGGDAGAKAGAEAGLRAAADALGISIDQLKLEKAERDANKNCALKIRLYAGNFKCSKPGGHVCKYALGSEEDNSVHLNPREGATTFILHKPGLNHAANSVSFELDHKRGMYLVKDGFRLVVAPFDGTQQYASRASFKLENLADLSPSSYGIRLYDSKDFFVCHSVGTSDVNVDKLSGNCAFHLVPLQLDMNSYELSCHDYCNKEDETTGVTEGNINHESFEMTPTQRRASTTETLRLLNSLAKHAVKIASEKFADHAQKVMTSNLDAQHKILHDQTYYEVLHSMPLKDSSYQVAHGHGIHANVDEDDKPDIYYIQIKFDNQIQSPLHGAAEVKTNIRDIPYFVANGAQMKVSIKVTDILPVSFFAYEAGNSSIPLFVNGTSRVTVHPTSIPPINPTLIVITNSESQTQLHPLGGDERPVHQSPPTEHAMDNALEHPTVPHQDALVYDTNNGQMKVRPPPLSPNPQQPPSSSNNPAIGGPISYPNEYAYHQHGYQKDTLPDVVEISYDNSNTAKKTITEIHMNKPKSVYAMSKNHSFLPIPKNDALTSSDTLKRQKNMTVRAHRKSLLLPKDADIYVIKTVDTNPLGHLTGDVDYTLLSDSKQNDVGHVRSDVESRTPHKNFTGAKFPDFTSNSEETSDSKNESFAEENHIANLVKTYRNLSSNIGDGLEDEITDFYDGMNTPESSRNFTTDSVSTTKITPSEKITPTHEVIAAPISNEADNDKDIFETTEKPISEEKFQNSLKSVEDKFVSADQNSTSDHLLSFTKNHKNTVLPLETGDEIFNMFQYVQPTEKIIQPNFKLQTFFTPSKKLESEEMNIERHDNSTGETELEEVSQRKTIMPNKPIENSYNKFETESNPLIAKKRLINTIKMLEENMYRAKLKTLSDFLKEYTSSDSRQSKRYAVWLAQHNHPKSWYYGIPVTGLKRSPIPRHFNNKQNPRMHIVHEDDDLIAPNKISSYITQPYYAHLYRRLPLHDEKRHEIPSRVTVNKNNAVNYLRAKLKREYLIKKARMLKDYLARKRYQIQTSINQRKFPNEKSKWLARQRYISYVKRNKLAKINWLKKNYCKCPIKCRSLKNRAKCIVTCERGCLKRFAHKIRKRSIRSTEQLDGTTNYENVNPVFSPKSRNFQTQKMILERGNIITPRNSKNYGKPDTVITSTVQTPNKFDRSKISDIPQPRTYSLKLPQTSKVALPFNLESPRFTKRYAPKVSSKVVVQKNYVPRIKNYRLPSNNRNSFKRSYHMSNKFGSSRQNLAKPFLKQARNTKKISKNLITQVQKYPRPNEYWKYYMNLPNANVSLYSRKNFRSSSSNLKSLGSKYYGNWNPYKLPRQPNIYTASNNMYNINAWFAFLRAKKNFQKALEQSRLDWMNFWKKNSNAWNKNRLYNTMYKKIIQKKPNIIDNGRSLKSKQMSAISKFLIPYKPLRNIFPILALPKKKKLLAEKVPKSSIPQMPNTAYGKWFRPRFPLMSQYPNYWYPNPMSMMFYPGPYNYHNLMPPSFANVLRAKYLYDKALHNYLLSTKYHYFPRAFAGYQRLMRIQRQSQNQNRADVPTPRKFISSFSKDRKSPKANLKAQVKPKRIVPKVKIITDIDNEKQIKYKTVTGDRRSIAHLNANKTLLNQSNKTEIPSNGTIQNKSKFEDWNRAGNISSNQNATADFNQSMTSNISDEINAISFLKDDDSETNAVAKVSNDTSTKNTTLKSENTPFFVKKIVLTGKNAPHSRSIKITVPDSKTLNENSSIIESDQPKSYHGQANKTVNETNFQKLFFKPGFKKAMKKGAHIKPSIKNHIKSDQLRNHSLSIRKEYNELLKHLVTGQNITDLLFKNKSADHNNTVEDLLHQKLHRRIANGIRNGKNGDHKITNRIRFGDRLKKFRDSNQYKIALAMLSKSGIPFYVHKHQPFREYMGFRGIHPINHTEFLMKRNTTLVDLKEEFEKFINHEEDKGTENKQEPGDEVHNLQDNNISDNSTAKNQDRGTDPKLDENNKQTNKPTSSDADLKNSNEETAEKGLNPEEVVKNNDSSAQPNNVPEISPLPVSPQSSIDDEKKKTNSLEAVKLEIENEEKEKERAQENKEKFNEEISILKKIKALAFAHHKNSARNLSASAHKTTPSEKPRETTTTKSPTVILKKPDGTAKILSLDKQDKNIRLSSKKENNFPKNETKHLKDNFNEMQQNNDFQSAVTIPHEIEALYSDRVENVNPDLSLVANKNENFNFDEGKSVSNHGSMYGDWFDNGFKPDIITKQDLKMSKSKYMNRLLEKQKEMKNRKVTDDAKFLFYGPTVKQVEDKIDYIVKNEETDEQRELQNLIKESIGTGNLDNVEQLAMEKEDSKNFASNGDDELKPGVNLTNKNKNFDENSELDFNAVYLDKPPSKQNDDSDIYLENQVVKSKSDNTDIEKILSDYKDDLSLGDGTTESFFDNPKEKGDVLEQVDEQNKKEIENLRHDLGRAISHGKAGVNLFSMNKNNFSDFNFEELAGDKKTINDLKNKTENSIKSAMMNLNKETVKVRHALDNQIKEFAENGGKFLIEKIRNLEKNVPTSKLFRKHNLQHDRDKNMRIIKEKWRKIKSKKFDDPSSESLASKSDDLLSRYFHEVETNEGINKTKQRNNRQEKRQKKIKATLRMINQLENQIDKMIVESEGRGDDKTTIKLKKLKRKGKAAIFHELLTGKLKHPDDKELNNPDEDDSENSTSNENEQGENEDENSEEFEGGGESIEPLNPDDVSQHLITIRKRPQVNEDSDERDENDIEPPNKNVQILNGLPRKPHILYSTQSSGENPSSEANQLNIMHDIASKDRSVSLQQAEALMDIQKQEVNQDLRKLKEITQDGLQSMFAKAVAKQQRFMDDIQGGESVAETRDQLSAQPRVQEQPIETSPSNNEKLIEFQYSKPRFVEQNEPIVKQFVQYRPEDMTGVYSDFSKSRIQDPLTNNNLISNHRVDDSDEELVDPDNSNEDGERDENDDVVEGENIDDNEKRSLDT